MGADLAIGSLLAQGGRTRPKVENSYFPAPEEQQATRDLLRKSGAKVYADKLDVRSDRSIERFLRGTIDALGEPDILVCAAGTDFNHPICDHPDEMWHKIIDTNLTGTYRMIKRCLPTMIRRRWGRIIIVASTSATTGSPLKPAYSASKAGLLGLMRCVALEGAPHFVTCNAISPATVETEMFNTTFLHTSEKTGKSIQQLREERLATYPQRRFLEPAEIAATIAFLCTEQARGITMENLGITGGAVF
jgi:NAD(P)-dependent dehydrogenase (short-subunit alcohol dehydrogenase family)